ncbi:MAG: TIGR01906 family membrane protein [Dehalococcoidia bacterium]|nr:TIGR01906 family membrane protein [Dehalococcoidia bacterium]
MRVFHKVTKWLFILCLPLILLSASIGGAANSLALYRYGFDKYDVSRTTGLSELELDRAARGLVYYFNSSDEYINLTVVKDNQAFTLFNQREAIHLKDVRGLFRLDYWILLGTLIYALIYVGFLIWLKEWHQLARGLLWGSGLTIGLIVVLGLSAMLNFDQFFLQFHRLSFTNELWQLDPSQDYLIMLFPRGFWYDATLFIAIATAVGAVILGGVGIYIFSSAGRNRG